MNNGCITNSSNNDKAALSVCVCVCVFPLLVLWWSQCRFRLERRKFLEYYYGRKKVEFVGIQILVLSGSWSEYWYGSMRVNQKPIFVEQRCCFSLIKLSVLSFFSPPPLCSSPCPSSSMRCLKMHWLPLIVHEEVVLLCLLAIDELHSCTPPPPPTPPHPAPNLHHPPFSPLHRPPTLCE